MIVFPHGFLTQAVSGDDADATAFINALTTAGVSLSSTEESAINTLVTDLKTAGVWTKMQAIYPFVGGTATGHKYNLADPQDTDAAFRLDFNGGWTHSATGADPNGTNAYADTHFNPNSDLASISSSHFAIYSRENIANLKVIMGAYDASVVMCMMRPTYTTETFWEGAYTGNVGKIGASLPNTQSLLMMSRTSSTLLTAYQCNSSVGTNTTTSSSACNINLFLSARNSGGITSLYDNREIAFASMGSSMTSSEQSDYYDAVQAFQTTLSRQV